ncbi:MAG: hypothetical protein AB7G39_18020, partial [Alphaproteobacteria bacterium]
MTTRLTWNGRLLAFAAALWCGLVAGAASGEGRPAIGAELRDFVEIGDKRVPLPAGRWVLAARERVTGFGSTKGAYGAVEQVVLLAVDDEPSAPGGRRVRGVAEIHANLMPTADGWGLPSECRRQEIHFAVVKYDSGWDGSCLFIANAFIDYRVDATPALRRVIAFARERDLVLPIGWLALGFRAADRQDFVDLRLYVDPRDAGLPAVARWGRKGDVWMRESASQSSRLQPYLVGLAGWSVQALDSVERGLRNAADMPALSWPGTETSQEAEKRRALDRLQALRESGLIDAESYAAQIAQIEAQPAPGAQATGWVSHAMKKNISFRVFGSTVDWVLAYTVTLSSPL